LLLNAISEINTDNGFNIMLWGGAILIKFRQPDVLLMSNAIRECDTAIAAFEFAHFKQLLLGNHPISQTKKRVTVE
jgi:hypothetical protein